MPKINYSLYTNQSLMALIIPLIIERTLFLTVGMADNMMVAYLGESSISAVALVDMINGFLLCIFLAMSLGGTVVASQYIGAQDRVNACRTVKQMLFVILIMSSVIMFFAEVFNRPLLKLLFGNITTDVMEQSVTYFRITALIYPFVGISASCNAMFRAQNLSKLSMYNSIICNILNIIGNAIFIYVFKWGVAGAALSTLLSHVITMFLAMYKITDNSLPIFYNVHKEFHASWMFIKKILFIGIPGGIEDSLFTFGRVLTVSLISRYGTSEIAANGLANQVDQMGCLVGSACNMAMVTVIGQCVGAGIESQLRYYLKKMMKWTYTCHIIWNLILLAFTPLILKCYTKIEPETIRTTLFLIIIHNGLGLLFWPASFTFPNALRAMNDVKATMFISLGSMFIVRIAASYMLAPLFQSGVYAVWTAMILDWFVRITLFHWRFFSGRWRQYAKMPKEEALQS